MDRSRKAALYRRASNALGVGAVLGPGGIIAAVAVSPEVSGSSGIAMGAVGAWVAAFAYGCNRMKLEGSRIDLSENPPKFLPDLRIVENCPEAYREWRDAMARRHEDITEELKARRIEKREWGFETTNSDHEYEMGRRRRELLLSGKRDRYGNVPEVEY